MSWAVEYGDQYPTWLRKLTKRFPKAGKDIEEEFRSRPPSSTFALPSFHSLLWKARVASSDLKRGKSGSFRVIYYWNAELPNWCCLGACYFKGDCEDLTFTEYSQLFVSVRARLTSFLEKQAREKEEKKGDSEPA